MADFARVLLAVDEVLGTDGYTTYAEQASRTAETVAEGDSVAVAIRETITEPWEGTASELLKLLTAEKPPKDWPTTPQGMGGRLARAAPSLRSLGWTVEQEPRTKKGDAGASDPPAQRSTGRGRHQRHQRHPPRRTCTNTVTTRVTLVTLPVGDNPGDDHAQHIPPGQTLVTTVTCPRLPPLRTTHHDRPRRHPPPHRRPR